MDPVPSASPDGSKAQNPALRDEKATAGIAPREQIVESSIASSFTDADESILSYGEVITSLFKFSKLGFSRSI